MQRAIEDITDAEIDAAARVIDAAGRKHGWWPSGSTYDDLDTISREEFKFIIAQALAAAEAVRPGARLP